MSTIYVAILNEFFANGKVNAYKKEKYGVNNEKNTSVRWGQRAFTVR